MASMVLVWNVVTAPCLVGEKVTKRGLLGTAVIITGSICATIFSQHDTPNYSLDDFAQRWSSPEVIIYEILVITIFIAHKIGLRQMQIQNSKQFGCSSKCTNDCGRYLCDDCAYGPHGEERYIFCSHCASDY